MKKQKLLLPFFIFLMILSGKIRSQATNALPLYRDGKLYLQLKSSSSVTINSAYSIVNDPSGSFQTLFTKYQVVKTELPYAGFNLAGLNRTYRVSFNQTARIDSFIIDLAHISAHVEYAEKVPAVYTFSVPNDPMLTSLLVPMYHLSLLNANQASDIHISNGNAVVAIVDDAVLTTHEDLAMNIGSVNTSSDVADADPDPNPPFSGANPVSTGYFTHGTHVAGIAGAVTNNSIGIASIGWNNKLMCVKTSSDNNTPPGPLLSNSWEGLKWASQNGAHVINMSWGTYAFSQTEYSVVVAAKNLGVVLVAAAGNAGSSAPLYPAAYGEGTTGQSWEVFDEKLVVAVAALDENNNIGMWGGGFASNYGHWVDISAYGTNIMSTLATSTLGSAIINTYGRMSGTSMAAPMVSGIAGVMRSYNMSKTADEIIDCLIYTANQDIYGVSHPSNQIGTLGYGRADAAAALRCVSSDCTVNPVVIIVPSSPSLCANTTLTLTANQGPATYSWSTGATTSSIVVNTAGVYTVLATYPNQCTATASINFATPPTLSLSLTTNTSICPGFSVNLISASGNYTSLVWQPGAMITNSAVINPTVYTVYSVTANQMCGGSTATIGVNPVNAPTPSGAYSVLSSTLSGNYMAQSNLSPFGHYILNSDAVVNTSATFVWSYLLMAPNVKITVPSSSSLNIIYSNFGTCGTDMWRGIVANDGAQVLSDKQSLIEDAITAISSTHTPLSSPGLPPAKIITLFTTFNRNYIDISLTNYYDNLPTPLSYTNLVKVYGCVFTCRNFTSTSWPGAGFWDPNGFSTGVRVASINTPTTGLISPYLWQYSTPANLKNPYNSQPSHIGINLVSVGITTGPQGTTNGTSSMPGVTIGDTTVNHIYNVFDRHGNFIVAQKSNVNLINNVFQNTQTYTITGGSLFGGSAVKHSAVYSSSDIMHTMLNMYGSSVSTGNRFWNCHRGIELKNTYLFSLQNSLFRSTQSTATVTGFLPGNSGIYAPTNNFDYYIANNEFTNLKTAINIPVSAGFIAPSPFPGQPATIGVFAHRIRIESNTFAAGTGTNTYMERAIDMTCPNSTPWQSSIFVVPGTSVTPFTQAFSITNNSLSRVFRGVSLNGSHGFQIDVSNNTIVLAEDNVFNPGLDQYGVQLTNCMPTSALEIGKNCISKNNVSFTVTPSNTAGGLIYCGDNGYGIASPSVSCNNITRGYQGFVFDGVNNNALWQGNTMTVPLVRGMVLSHTAAIGTQGSTNTAIANQWVGGGGSWAGNNYGTWVASGSQATASVLYVRPVSSYSPVNNNGGFNPNNYALNSGFKYMTYINGGDYVCGDFPNHKISIPRENQYTSGTPYYRAKSALFRFLNFNDSIRESDSGLKDFYDNESGSSIDKFLQVEKLIYQGRSDDAEDVLNDIDDSAFNSIETNYRDFYTLYLTYLNLSASQHYPTISKNALKTMATLCPGKNGPVVYQAIALYNSIYGEVLIPNCSESGARMARIDEQGVQNPFFKTGDLDMFPNPATNQITLVSKQESEDLYIEITDLSNRLVQTARVKTNAFFANLELSLVNGLYLVTIKDAQNDETIKKLVITR